MATAVDLVVAVAAVDGNDLVARWVLLLTSPAPLHVAALRLVCATHSDGSMCTHYFNELNRSVRLVYEYGFRSKL